VPDDVGVCEVRINEQWVLLHRDVSDHHQEINFQVGSSLDKDTSNCFQNHKSHMMHIMMKNREPKSRPGFETRDDRRNQRDANIITYVELWFCI
jgi:predicted GH43/DUF377 family glycosyl hydrolase